MFRGSTWCIEPEYWVSDGERVMIVWVVGLCHIHNSYSNPLSSLVEQTLQYALDGLQGLILDEEGAVVALNSVYFHGLCADLRI